MFFVVFVTIPGKHEREQKKEEEKESRRDGLVSRDGERERGAGGAEGGGLRNKEGGMSYELDKEIGVIRRKGIMVGRNESKA